MAVLTVSQNDYGYIITDTLEYSNGAPFDLTGYAVNFHTWNANRPGRLLVNSGATVVSNANGTVSYTVAANDFTILGSVLQEWEATKTNVRQSFPTTGNRVVIKESPK